MPAKAPSSPVSGRYAGSGYSAAFFACRLSWAKFGDLCTKGLSMGKEDQFTLSKRALRALSETDAMYPELKKCVHEFGYPLVNQCYQYGIREPNKIRSLILSIWRGAREPTQDPKLGVNHSPVLNNLDWILMNAEAKVSAVQLLRILKDNQLVIVPLEPSTVMVNASVEAVKNIGTVTKSEKHKWRLKCAIEASAKRMWPHLFT